MRLHHEGLMIGVQCQFLLAKLLATHSLLILVTARSVRILLECFLVSKAVGHSFTARPCYGAVGTHPTGMLSC